jgi:O-acetyl-ADP-ribose deacetylase
MILKEVVGDLLDQDVDAIVNPWNRNFIPWWLLLPQGVSGAIKRRAGTAPFREVATQGLLPLGGAVVTCAGRLPHKAIIHVAGINALWTATETSIRRSVQNAVAAARERGFRSLALPAIGAGSGRFDEEKSVELIKAVLQHLDYDGEVTIVRFRRR